MNARYSDARDQAIKLSVISLKQFSFYVLERIMALSDYEEMDRNGVEKSDY